MKDNPALPGGSLKSKPTLGASQNVPHVGFFIGPLALRQERQHHKSREIKKFATGCVPSHNLGSDDHGRLSKPTDQRPKPKSLVRLLPASAIRPMVGFRQGRWRPDQIVPKRRNLELSRFPALFLEVPSLEEQGMNHAHHESMCRRGCTGLLRRVSVDASPQVRVTLSDDFLNHLRKMAQSKHVPLRWLVA